MKTCLVIAYIDALYGVHARIECKLPDGEFAWMFTPEEAETTVAGLQSECDRLKNTIWKFKIVNFAE